MYTRKLIIVYITHTHITYTEYRIHIMFIQCMMYTVHYTLYTIQCILYFIIHYCILYTMIRVIKFNQIEASEGSITNN